MAPAPVPHFGGTRCRVPGWYVLVRSSPQEPFASLCPPRVPRSPPVPVSPSHPRPPHPVPCSPRNPNCHRSLGFPRAPLCLQPLLTLPRSPPHPSVSAVAPGSPPGLTGPDPASAPPARAAPTPEPPQRATPHFRSDRTTRFPGGHRGGSLPVCSPQFRPPKQLFPIEPLRVPFHGEFEGSRPPHSPKPLRSPLCTPALGTVRAAPQRALGWAGTPRVPWLALIGQTRRVRKFPRATPLGRRLLLTEGRRGRGERPPHLPGEARHDPDSSLFRLSLVPRLTPDALCQQRLSRFSAPHPAPRPPLPSHVSPHAAQPISDASSALLTSDWLIPPPRLQ